MPKAPSRRLAPIRQLVEVMAALRAPEGCPWDREQDHRSLRSHAVEEVYELLDAIEAGDDGEMAEELGDLLLQVVFHAQLGRERGVFDFDSVCQHLVDKLIRRHPHVFGSVTVKDVDQVWANWESIKKAEKAGSKHERKSALDGVPRHLPALMRSQKLLKKAAKAGLTEVPAAPKAGERKAMAQALFDLTAQCQAAGWSAEELLRAESQRRESAWRRAERRNSSR
jgi:tetrapyrrole methylase family protein/MazG family protein